MLFADMFWYLLLAHFVGDYPLQTDWMVKFKSKWFGLGSHIVAHVFSIYLIVFFFGQQDRSILNCSKPI